MERPIHSNRSLLLVVVLTALAGAGAATLENPQTGESAAGHHEDQEALEIRALDNTCPIEVREKGSDLLTVVVTPQDNKQSALLEFDDADGNGYYILQFWKDVNGQLVLAEQKVAQGDKMIQVRLAVNGTRFKVMWSYDGTNWTSEGHPVLPATYNRSKPTITARRVAKNHKEISAHIQLGQTTLAVRHKR